MFVSPRIRLKPLTLLCQRLAIATNAGLEDRRIWSDEAERGSGALQRSCEVIRDELAAGNSLTDALAKTGDYFPKLFRSMVSVGETSGQLGKTYKRLTQHYEKTLAARRTFMAQLAWPILQFTMALGVIGLLIWIMGISAINPPGAQQKTDILGFGLIGNRGLVIYLNIIIFFVIAVLLVIEAARRGALWTKSLQRAAISIPVIGGALKTLALARFTWALQLVLDTPMDLRRALPLALDASGNDYFSRHGRDVALQIQNGSEIYTALATTGAFPVELLDQIAVGEKSGRLVETMEHQAEHYQEKATMAIFLLAQFTGYGVWVLVAAFIIFMIFRLFFFYTQQITNLL